MKTTYIGYRIEDQQTAYAAYFEEDMWPIQQQAADGLLNSPYAAGQMPEITQIAQLQQNGYAAIENGYVLEQDGSIKIAILTHMPMVQAKMWDWWFAWHGSHDNRYKLWHPKAHKAAKWQDGRADLTHYRGRTSLIEEYIGASLEKAAIRFLEPTELGFPSHILPEQETFICARVGYQHVPLDFGYLVHHVRNTAQGAEMRSRFFMGGEHIAFRGGGAAGDAVATVLRRLIKLPEQRAKDLLNHCAEEMQHLARRLPALYAQFGKGK